MGCELLSAALRSSVIAVTPGDVLRSVLRLYLHACLCYEGLFFCWGSDGFSVDAFGWRSPLCWMAGAQRGFVPSTQGGMSAALWGSPIRGDALLLCCAPMQCQIHIAHSSI